MAADNQSAEKSLESAADSPAVDSKASIKNLFGFRPVFTPTGGIILAVALFILIRSLLSRNSYEILLSSATLLLMLLIGIVGFWKSKKLKDIEPGWKPPFPMTACAGERTLVTGLDAPLPLFFRLHFIVRGSFFPVGFSGGDGGGCPVLAETSVTRGESTGRLEFDFPMSGVFRGRGYCRLRDVFGLFSFRCGTTQQRILKVRSAPCFGNKIYINAQSGAEDKRNKTSSNEERYYMREYTPGDRFRDINWKSSEKIDSLITRISPDNQEKVSHIEVYFRNYGPSNKTSLEALWLLDRAKARLSYFLRSLKEEQSSYVFDVRAANCSWEIEDEEDLDSFLEDLAGLSFSPLQNDTAANGAPLSGGISNGQLYVFSTACDAGLPGFLTASAPRPICLFLVQPEVPQALRQTAEPETLHKLNFLSNGAVPFPRWLLRAKLRPSGARAGKVEMIYAETRI